MSYHLLGWVGRKKRRECAHVVAAKLAAGLADQPDGAICSEAVDQRYLNAFLKRPLSPSLNAQLAKLVDRLRAELKVEANNIYVGSQHNAVNGKLVSLIVSAHRYDKSAGR